MSLPPRATFPGEKTAWWLFGLILAAQAWALGVFVHGGLARFAVPTAYAAPLVLAALLALAVSLARKGPARAPLWAVLAVVVLNFGGTSFDMIATVVHTPDLAREGNVFARAMLDSGAPVAFVYAYSILAKGLLATLECTLWVGLLKHRALILESLRRPMGPLQFLKAVVGAAHMRWYTLLFFVPLRRSTLPSIHMLIWLIAVLSLGSGVQGFCLGLQWCELTPRIHIPVTLAAMGVFVVIYLVWLWRASRPHAEQGQQPGRANASQP